MAASHLRAKTYFLTFPQSTKTADEVLNYAKTFLKPDWVAVVTEKHSDGHDHQHCVCHWEDDAHYETFQRLDTIFGQHGNYQAARSVSAVAKYISKDNTPLLSGITPEAFNALITSRSMKPKMSIRVYHAIRSGATISSLARGEDEELAAWLMLNANRVIAFFDMYPNPVIPRTVVLCDISVSTPKTVKRGNLYLTGKPNTGKTYWVTHNFNPMKYVKAADKWDCPPDTPDCLFIDDLTPDDLALKKPSWSAILGFSNGDVSVTVYKKPMHVDLPLIICSNYDFLSLIGEKLAADETVNEQFDTRFMTHNMVIRYGIDAPL